MQTVLGVLIAAAPFLVVGGLLLLAGARDRRRVETWRRQIALTDAIHERLGAVAAPEVRRRRAGWQVRLAAPFDRPARMEPLLAIVVEAFAPPRRRPSRLEIVLTRQAPRRPAVTTTVQPAGKESLSWT